MKKTVLLLLLWPLLHFVGLCQLNNTTWKLKVTPTCYDTLKLGNEQNSYYYSCELDYKIQITYSTLSDTLFLYEYDYIDDNDPPKGIELQSKWKLIIKKDKLKPFYIAHKRRNEFEEVDKNIYDNIGEFDIIR